MRAVQFSEHGPPAVLRVAEVPEPAPGRSDVLVEVVCASVTFAEVMFRRGQLPVGLPHVPGLAVSGRVDRIDQRGDELVVVDYKTGRAVLTTDDARGSMALALYALAAARTLRRACTRVELHHLPSGTVASFEHTERSLANHVRRAEDIAEDITAATQKVAAGTDPDDAFPAVPGRQCGWCDFRPACPVGQAATPAREPWSFLPEVDG